ncbi:YceH family protein [Pedobacter duraquae]|uniref:Uncharacterized protein n=1 Tax=Pedobacter duraquae TaxID=425511 RepID=A0A4R6ILV4_9SPHI|nr:YceH family protein [Pedobacter duraquae]TDO23051.1 hypothetical protein CLV32_2037 [Pedobacter duraquae]
MEDIKPLIQLSAIEQRIIGVLIEKSRTTPDYYPMSINGLTAACNQKTSRNPVVNYDEETVVLTLNGLKIKGLASTVTGAGSRAVKWKHNLAIMYPLLPSDLSIVCLLLLRGPSTPGEINTNSGLMYEFETIEEVQESLQKLATSEPTYVKQLAKKAGQKEARYMHLFGGAQEPENPEQEITAVAPNTDPALEERISKLEQEVQELREMLNLLM